jgi:hypothetical protein
MAALYLIEPRHWYVNDKRNQYVPVLQDIGRRLRSGDFPVLDPDLGPSGNYALDSQYAIFDPLHLSTAWGLSYVGDLRLAGFLLALVYLVVLAWGVTALLQRLGVDGVLASVGGLAGATSGFVFFYLGMIWWPGLTGLAFLPWMWWAWLGTRPLARVLAVALFSYLVIASGWPSTWLAYVAMTAGLAIEAWARRDREAGVRAWLMPLASGAAAAAAGLVVAAVHLVALLRAADWTNRSQEVGNDFFQIVNLADVLAFAAPYLQPDLVTFGGGSTARPIFFFGWFLLAFAWMTLWRRDLVRQRGVVTAAVAVLILLLLTQAPSDMGPVRSQFRQLAGLQLFAVMLGTIAFAASGAALTRVRVLGVAASMAAVAFLAWARSPQEAEVWAVAASAVAILGVVLAARRWGTSGAGATALVASLPLVVLAFVLSPLPQDRHYPTGTNAASSVRAAASERPVLVLYGPPGRAARARWPRQGVGVGFAAMDRDNRYSPGYSSVSQKPYRERLRVISAHGFTRPGAVDSLFETEATTGRRWVDLLGYRTIVVARSRLERFERLRTPEWYRLTETQDFVKFVRPDGAVAGRVTAVVGAVEVSARTVEDERQRYRVSAPSAGRLVFRDIYWPGYVARLDGRDLPVEPFGDLLVSVQLPPGTDGVLEVRFRALRPANLVATLGGGLVLLLAACGLASRERRRSRRGLGDGG